MDGSGIVVFCKIMRSETGESKGFGFVSYDGFEASDAAMAGMNGQYLCNRQISVSYSYKKDSKGERHGTAAERMIAANRESSQPHHVENEYYASVGASAMPQAAPAPLAGSNLPTPPAPPPGMSAPSSVVEWERSYSVLGCILRLGQLPDSSYAATRDGLPSWNASASRDAPTTGHASSTRNASTAGDATPTGNATTTGHAAPARDAPTAWNGYAWK
ncbi:spliceosome associated protein, putative [Perkinsus marinus ATCC 50983]|uniref:Spliceosome associated protein, putative n=1 Tax=Perkinsus marinus (strain ATCC 50983 / TXsc) TaxID=423536 RepID=C5LDD3_PERM5|nr:spliceosome associated protein, putative [Perkinsus marinus ATCC 50983]EER05265.1 spliceosome associated protein, putative [Perkinsus marinus ATCC 50983]|eukprot:XP_002773449.1 spliceosome associated protein, putative [Perkinsus marinus ATCC 50983]